MHQTRLVGRLFIMVINLHTIIKDQARPGHFTDVTDTLLPLFTDPDGRGSRRWREMFGLERPVQRTPRGGFIANEALRSSSD